MTMQSLLDQIEATGYVDDHGHLLTNDRAWHELRQCIKGHPGWPGTDLSPVQVHVHGDLDAPYSRYATEQLKTAKAVMGEINKLLAPAPDFIQIPEGFTPWYGGARPVSSLIEADVILRNGARGTDVGGKASLDWKHNDSPGDIIAYRHKEWLR